MLFIADFESLRFLQGNLQSQASFRTNQPFLDKDSVVLNELFSLLDIYITS